MQGLYYAEARERLLHRNELSFVPCLCCRIALCFSSPPEAKPERTLRKVTSRPNGSNVIFESRGSLLTLPSQS